MSAPAPEIRADRSSLRRVVDALGDRVRINRGDQLYALCPVPEHADHRKPSLSVTWVEKPRNGKGGQVFLKCHRGCTDAGPDLVASALGLERADLFDTPPFEARAGRRRKTPARPATAHPNLLPKKPASSGDPANPPVSSSAGYGVEWGELIATHVYTDAAGVRLFDVRRWAGGDQKYSVRTYDKAGRRVVRKAAPATDRRVLYNLPAVVAAIAAGELVYVVEGEKDADALTAAGVVATTNAFGAADNPNPATAAGKWLPQYTETLRGAHVVIVADRDTAENGAIGRGLHAGYRHARFVAGQLAGVAASVSVVQARAGKDAADHLAAGYGVDEFTDLAPAELDQLAAGEKAGSGSRTSFSDSGLPDDLAALAEVAAAAGAAPAPARVVPADPAERGRVLRPPFPRHDDEGDAGDNGSGDRHGGGGGAGGGAGGGDNGEPEKPWTRRTQKDRFEVREDGVFKVTVDEKRREVKATELLSVPVRITGRYAEDLCDGAPRELTHLDLLAARGEDRHVLAGVELRRWDLCSWVNDLPWPAWGNDHGAGRAALKKALLATAGEVPLTPMYGALGWQQIDGRWRYVHAGGVLDSSGPVEGLRVNPPDLLRRFALPSPPRDDAELLDAIEASVALMDAVPARLAAPLLGSAYRAVLGFCRATVMPVGTKSSGKTGLAAATIQHYVPTARHDNMPGAGAGEDAGTGPGLEELRYRAGDMLLPLDDLAPDKGTERASSRCALIARSQYNRTGKVRMRRDGGLRPVHPPRSLPLVTGEESTTVESAESRLVLLRVHAGDVNIPELAKLDEDRGPELRATLTAAMVQHYADRMPLDDWIGVTRSRLAAELMDPAAPDAGLDSRLSSSVAELAVGWRAMLDMAIARNAMPAEMAETLWALAWEGLVEAKRRMADGSARRTAADRVRELLAALLVRQSVGLYTREGGAPASHELERYGWDHEGRDGSPRMVGDPVGWTDGVKVWLHPGALVPFLAAQSRAESDPLTYSIRGLGEALADAGVVTTVEDKGIRRNQVQLRMAGQKQRVWEFDHAWLFGTDEADDDDPAGGPDDGPGKGGEPAGPAAPAEVPPAPHRADPLPLPSPSPAPSPATPAATPEPGPDAARSRQDAVSDPAPTKRAGRAENRSERRTEPQTGPRQTYLSEWLGQQYPEAGRADLAAAEELWHSAMAGVEFRGPFDTARRILNGLLQHQSIPELATLDPRTLDPVMSENAQRWIGRTWMVPGDDDPLPAASWITSYDVNGMFLSAGTCELGTGDPELTKGRPPAGWQKCPGWVQLARAADKAPHGLADRLPAGMWVPVPLAVYLEERKALPALSAALLWAQHRRWLGPHVTRFREARKQVAGVAAGCRDCGGTGHQQDGIRCAGCRSARLVERAIKATNTRLFGGALRSADFNEGPTLRPDWAEMIVATAQARMLRGLDKTSARLIGVHVDAAWFVMPAADAVPAGLEISTQLGKWKPHGRTAITPELIEAHRVGMWRPIYNALEASAERVEELRS